ncbi:MAG: hypothetical protein WD928_06900 [Gammaproteobacteria bacterium]
MRRQFDSGDSRAAIAAIAARHLADGSAADFDDARRRAQSDLSLQGRRDLPDNREIQRALAEYLALFEGEELAERLLRLRRAALRALDLFKSFSARLCGPVWYGTACAHTPVSVHLISDEIEAVTRFLLERRIHYRLGEASCRFADVAGVRRVPRFEITFADEEFDLLVFPASGACRHPLSALDHKPVKRVGATELEALIESGRLFTDQVEPRG